MENSGARLVRYGGYSASTAWIGEQLSKVNNCSAGTSPHRRCATCCGLHFVAAVRLEHAGDNYEWWHAGGATSVCHSWSFLSAGIMSATNEIVSTPTQVNHSFPQKPQILPSHLSHSANGLNLSLHSCVCFILWSGSKHTLIRNDAWHISIVSPYLSPLAAIIHN